MFRWSRSPWCQCIPAALLVPAAAYLEPVETIPMREVHLTQRLGPDRTAFPVSTLTFSQKQLAQAFLICHRLSIFNLHLGNARLPYPQKYHRRVVEFTLEFTVQQH